MREHLNVDRATLDYYAAPGRFTTIDAEAGASDIREIVDLVQGLMVYDVVAQPFYGVELAPEQADAIHERDSARYLAIAHAVDERPLNEARPPANRVTAAPAPGVFVVSAAMIGFPSE